MNLSSNELFKAVRNALYTGTAAAVALTAAPAFAQDPQSETQSLETVTVTGSRIRKADVETAQPIVVLDRAAIDKQGFNSIADILQNLPEAGSNPLPRSRSLAAGEDVGGYYIDIRNLGSSRTLVLLNGKRLGASTSGAQDLSQVPMAAVERIEVLKDGASAIYGSDAIAGVVNIITRRNYDGAQFDSYVSQQDEGDGDVQTYSMTMGTHTDRGSITFSAEYGKSDPVLAKARPRTRYPQGINHPTTGWTSVSQWGFFYAPENFCGNTGAQTCTLNPGGNPFNQSDYHVTGAGGGLNDRSNPTSQQFFQTGLEHHSLFVSGDYSITDNIRFKSDILYNRRNTKQQNAGYPYQSAAFGQSLSVDSYYNPIGSQHPVEGVDPANIYFVRRTWELPRRETSSLDTYRFSAGLEGTFDIGERTWNWDVGGYVNTNDLRKSGVGNLNLLNVSQALGPSFYDPVTNQVMCGTADNPIPYGSAPGSCVPWNPLLPAGQAGSGSLGNKELQQFLAPQLNDIGRTKEVEYSANLTGPVFSLPAGDVNVAAGYEYRNVTGKFTPDALKQTNNGSTDLANAPTNGGYKVDEYYVEIDVPILKDVPFARELTFNAAARYSDYNTFGETTNPKFSLTWRPIEDLLVRANYAKGFRAPTVSDLYGGTSGTFEGYDDPCDTRPGTPASLNPDVLARCVGGFGGRNPTNAGFIQPMQGFNDCEGTNCQSPVAFLSGSNPNLKPETSTSRTLGFVYSPKWIEGFDISVDWYRVRIQGAITGDSVQQQLDDCYILGVASRCAGFQRAEAGVAPFPRFDGFVLTALSAGRNAGWLDTKGYDIGFKYRLPEFSFGRFTIDWNTNYVDYNNNKPDDLATTPISTDVGRTADGTGAPRIRSVANLDWSLGNFGATWTARYWSSLHETCPAAYPDECNMPDYISPDLGAAPRRRIGANTFHDAQVRWTAPWNALVSVGVTNVFDHQPSVYYSQLQFNFGQYVDYDIGRSYYVRYTQKF